MTNKWDRLLRQPNLCHCMSQLFWAGLINYSFRRLNQLLCMLITSLIYAFGLAIIYIQCRHCPNRFLQQNWKTYLTTDHQASLKPVCTWLHPLKPAVTDDRTGQNPEEAGCHDIILRLFCNSIFSNDPQEVWYCIFQNSTKGQFEHWVHRLSCCGVGFSVMGSSPLSGSILAFYLTTADLQ